MFVSRRLQVDQESNLDFAFASLPKLQSFHAIKNLLAVSIAWQIQYEKESGCDGPSWGSNVGLVV